MSASGLHTQPSDSCAQPLRVNTAAQALLSKFKMSILVSESSSKLFSSVYLSILECRDLALSFTLCRRFFIESVEALRIQEGSVKSNRPYWHVIIVQLDGHHSFLAEVEALAAMTQQIKIYAADFHMLFVDGDLFGSLAKDEDLQWPASIKGYVRFAAGKVVEIIYGARFSAGFLRSIR